MANDIIKGMGFHHIGLKAADFQKSIKFYTDLGMKEIVRWGEGEKEIVMFDLGDGGRIELFANGESLGRKKSLDHFFYFYVKNTGETKLLAIAGDCKDESKIRKTESFNEEYRLRETGAVLNWFEIDSPHGYLSLNSKMSEIMTSDEGKALIQDVFARFQNVSKKGASSGGFEPNREMFKMMEGFTLLRLVGMLGVMNISFTREELLLINEKLNKIKK